MSYTFPTKICVFSTGKITGFYSRFAHPMAKAPHPLGITEFPHGSRALIQEMSRGTRGRFKILWRSQGMPTQRLYNNSPTLLFDLK